MEYILNQPIATGEKMPNELLKKRDAIGAMGAMTMHLIYNRQAILEMIEERNRNQENTSDVSKKKYTLKNKTRDSTSYVLKENGRLL